MAAPGPGRSGATSRRRPGAGCSTSAGQVTFGDEAALDAIAGCPGGRRRARRSGSRRPRRPRRFPGSPRAAPCSSNPHRACWPPITACGPCATTGRLRRLRTGVPVHVAARAPATVAVVTTAAAQDLRCRRRRRLRRARALLGLLGETRPWRPPPSLPQVAYFRPGRRRAPAALPVFIEWGDDMIYGLPVPGGGPHGGTYKVSHHTPGTALDPFDPTDPAPFADDPALLAVLTGAVARLLPGPRPRAGGDRALRLRQLRGHRLRPRPRRPRRRRVRHQRARVQVRAAARRDPGRPGRGDRRRRSTSAASPCRPGRPADGRAASPVGSLPCPATSHCSGASTSPATAASPCTSCGRPSSASATPG